jgi:hypothetical protein
MAKIDNELMKRAVIAGAAHALKYKRENPKDAERDVLRKVISDTKKIIREIEEE